MSKLANAACSWASSAGGIVAAPCGWATQRSPVNVAATLPLDGLGFAAMMPARNAPDAAPPSPAAAPDRKERR